MGGLPPTPVFGGTRDILDSDGVCFAACNPAVVLKHYLDVFHAWSNALISEVHLALDEVAAFIRQTMFV